MVSRKIIRPREGTGARRRREKSRYFGLFPLEMSLKIVKKSACGGQNIDFMLVYRRSVDKHKNSKPQKCCPPAAAGEIFLVTPRVYRKTVILPAAGEKN